MTSPFSHSPDLSVMHIGQVALRLARPLALQQAWMGDQDILRQLLACWFIVDEKDVALSPRIVGQPGVGKTTLAMAATQERKQELFIYQCTADTRPEDLLVSPVISEGGTITYQASPLVTAMLTGNVCLLDEGNRMNEKSWASLASLLDHRRSVDSVVAGVQIQAHENFRCCVTMNEDASTYEVPDYILSRLQPTLKVEFPKKEHELAILRYHLPFASAELITLTVNFLQKAHQLDLPFSIRDGMHMVQYAMKRMAQDPHHPVARDPAWREALVNVLGEEARDLDVLAKRRSQTLHGQVLPKGLGDFFFEEDHPLHPDQ